VPRGDPQTAAVVARWRRADERLYPVVMVDPARYARILRVVRDTADRLAESVTVEGLVRARRRGDQLVALSCAAVGVPIESLGDVETVADAAFSLRHREVEIARRRQEIAARILAARTRSDGWVTLDESGLEDQPGLLGFQRTDMRLADGSAIRAAVDVDPDSFRPIYSIEHLRLDPDTGAVAERPVAGNTLIFDDPAPWSAAIAQWRSGAVRP
jgi:hypothetical protein